MAPRTLTEDIAYLAGAEAHADEGPIGEPSARSILEIALRHAHALKVLRAADPDRLDQRLALANLLDRATSGPVSALPWSVVPDGGKPILRGQIGNIARGYIATHAEFDLIVAAVNALPGLLADATALKDEVTYWRQDAAARLRTAMTLARAADARGEEERAADIRVGIIFPTRAALAGALSGDIYWPLCEGCSQPIQEGDAVYAVSDDGGECATGQVHVDCDRPQPTELPEHAYRYADHPEDSPEGIAQALAAAQAFDGED